MRQPLQRTIRYREGYNPLRGLTLARAVALLEAGERGDYADLQWTYRHVEKRDPTVRAVTRRLRDAITSLDWNIKVVDQRRARRWDGALAAEQALALREAYDRIENLREALAWLALADLRGYAHLERIVRADGELVRLEPVPQWHWCRDGLYGTWQYNPESRSGTRGIPVDLARLVWREVDDPADEIFLIAYLRKNLSQKDWDGFIEVYGIPWIFLIGPPNLPDDKAAEFQTVAEQLAADGRGYLPNGSDVKTADPAVRTNSPFSEHLRYQDEQIVLAGTGGKLTMLSDATGIGSGASGAHQETWTEIACSQALLVSEILQRAIDKALLDTLWPGREALAYFELAAVDAEDADALVDRAVKLSQIGFRLDPAELSERTGLRVAAGQSGQAPAATTSLPSANVTITHRAAEEGGSAGPEQIEEERLLNDLVERALARALEVAPEWIGAAGRPVAELLRLAEAGELDADALLARAEEIAATYPELVGDMPVERLAGVLEGAMGAAAVQGVRAALRDAPVKSPRKPSDTPGGMGTPPRPENDFAKGLQRQSDPVSGGA